MQRLHLAGQARLVALVGGAQRVRQVGAHLLRERLDLRLQRLDAGLQRRQGLGLQRVWQNEGPKKERGLVRHPNQMRSKGRACGHATHLGLDGLLEVRQLLVLGRDVKAEVLLRAVDVVAQLLQLGLLGNGLCDLLALGCSPLTCAVGTRMSDNGPCAHRVAHSDDVLSSLACRVACASVSCCRTPCARFTILMASSRDVFWSW